MVKRGKQLTTLHSRRGAEAKDEKNLVKVRVLLQLQILFYFNYFFSYLFGCVFAIRLNLLNIFLKFLLFYLFSNYSFRNFTVRKELSYRQEKYSNTP